MSAARKRARQQTQRAKKDTNGKAEIALNAEDAATLKDADLALARLKLALADLEMQASRLNGQRQELIAAVERAQQEMYARGKAIADRFAKNPDERWNLDLARMVLHRL